MDLKGWLNIGCSMHDFYDDTVFCTSFVIDFTAKMFWTFSGLRMVLFLSQDLLIILASYGTLAKVRKTIHNTWLRFSTFLCLMVLVFDLQVLSFRYWMHISIMFRVWPGIHCPNILPLLAQIELVEFMPISLKNPKVLRR